MRIVHVQLSGPYMPGMGYQENILSKKHQELGHNVSLISYSDNKDIDQCIDGVDIYFLKKRNDNSILKRIPIVRILIYKFVGLYDKLEELHPDVIFIHSVFCPDYLEIVKYSKKHPDVNVYADSHVDYYNWPIKNNKDRIRKHFIYGYIARRVSNVCKVVWGVSPWRCKYLIDVFGVDKKKVDLLVMGGDENYIKWNEKTNIKREIRKEYDIPEDAFLIVTGGKIDRTKNIHILMEAVSKIKRRNVYLLIFGRFETDEPYTKFLSDKIKYIGWLSSIEVYPILLSADLGCFPGTHSVLWEQACASGLPCIFKNWDEGFNHVDVGGNCLIIDEITVNSITSSIEMIMDNEEMYSNMLAVASTKAKDIFSYINIARRSINI